MCAPVRVNLVAPLLASIALAAPATVGLMPVEAPESEATGRRILTALRAGVAGTDGLLEKGPVGMGLDEARMTFSCFDESAACMAQVGGLLEVDRLVWAHLARKDGRWSLRLRHLDVAGAEMVRDEDLVVMEGLGDEARLADLAEAFIRGESLSSNAGVQLTVESRPDGATVLLDGREVGVTPLTVPTAQGAHRLELRAEGMMRAAKTVELATDDTVRVQLVPAGVSVAPGGQRRSTGFWLGVGTGGLAVAASGVSTYYGLETLRLRREVEDELNQENFERVEPDFDRAKLITNVGWGVAAVSAGLSAYFFLLHDDVTAGIGATPGGATVKVRW